MVHAVGGVTNYNLIAFYRETNKRIQITTTLTCLRARHCPQRKEQNGIHVCTGIKP